jgi:glutamyl-tRNA reductase
MSLAVFAITHQNAPIEVRERFAFTPQSARALLRQLVGNGVAGEAVLLSTCNRTELYLHMPSSRCPVVLLRLLSRYAGLSDAEAKNYIVRKYDRQAAEHLFRVAAGLESLVLGEAQIQGQVCDALQNASAEDSTRVVGPVLARLFQTALRVGGQVRSETELGVGSGSIASTAVHAARQSLGSLTGRTVLVVGAGEMARLALACLSKERAQQLYVANRTPERAHALAATYGARVIAMDEIGTVMPQVDVLISATSAPHPIVSAAQLRAAQVHDERDRVVLDLAVPRDVEPAVAEIPRVRLFTTDDLNHRVQQNLARRQSMVPTAERIVGEGVAEFWNWCVAREVVPVIRSLRDQAETVRRQEAERCLNRLRHLSDADRELIEGLTRRLMNKVLHTPTVRLREAGVSREREAVVGAARYLFDIGPETDETDAAGPATGDVLEPRFATAGAA